MRSSALRGWGIGVLVVVAWCLLSAVPASAEDAERISSYDVVLTVVPAEHWV